MSNLYEEDFKKELARLAVESSQPMAQTARDLSVSKSVLYAWVKKYEPGYQHSLQKVSSNKPPVTQELLALQKEVKQLRKERDILKKAAANDDVPTKELCALQGSFDMLDVLEKAKISVSVRIRLGTLTLPSQFNFHMFL